MSIENAILELAKAITIHAEVLREINQPIISGQQETKGNDVSFEAPKVQRKSKKIKKTEEVVAGNVVVSVDPAKSSTDETAIRYSDPVETKIEMTISNPPKAAEPHEEVKIGNIIIKSAETITSEMCKNLAKEKMAAGIDRTKIKALITEMGAESIADLTERNLVEFYTKLQEIK